MFTVYLLFIVVWLSRYVQIPVAVCLFRRTCRHSLRTRVDLSTPSTSTPLSLPPISRSGTPHSGPWTPATRGALSTSADLSRFHRFSNRCSNRFSNGGCHYMSLHVTTNVLYACVSSDGFGVFYHVLKVLEDRLEDRFDQFCQQIPLMGQHMTIGVRTKGTSQTSLVYDGRCLYTCVVTCCHTSSQVGEAAS